VENKAQLRFDVTDYVGSILLLHFSEPDSSWVEWGRSEHVITVGINPGLK
jgi:hypothetical protein